MVRRKPVTSKSSSVKRTRATPEISTIAEAGVPGFEFESWTGFLAPPGTPPDVISKINGEVVRITRLPETNERLPGFEWIGSSPQAFADHIKSNIGFVIEEQ